MINELDSVDWSSMRHAYGPAGDVPGWLRGMASTDPEVRDQSLGHFYSAAHHQGDVYPCTVRSLPFLFALADNSGTPDRAAVVELLLSVGREAVGRGEGLYYAPDGTVSTAYSDAAALIRERADAFVRHAADPDVAVRRAALPGLGLFLDDADLAVGILRGRLPAASGIVERLLVVRTMADLALRLPAARGAATAWLDSLTDDTTFPYDIRLAAVVHRARCAPYDIGPEVVPMAVELLERLTAREQDKEPESGRETATGGASDPSHAGTAAPEAPAGQDVPPQIAAAFASLERYNRVHAPTTSLLRTFHAALDARVPERTAVLASQLRSSDPATRFDAIRMAQDLILAWRGDHTELVGLLASLLLPRDPYTAAAAAECLGSLTPRVAEPAREALASYVAAQRDAYGPGVWATAEPHLRRAHQEAVLALARLGDLRAVPDLLTALDSGIDAWRAVQVAGSVRAAAGELVPRLVRSLAGVDLASQASVAGAGALLSALAELGDPVAVPVIADLLTAAVRHGAARTGASALDALASFGSAATCALDVVRPLGEAEDVDLRVAAVAALWELEGDVESVVPRLHDLLDSYRHDKAAEVLGRIGPAAAPALPRLRQMLTAGYEWTRVHAATALWDIGGVAEGPDVFRILLDAWEENDATANHVLACLDRMGEIARPALPRIRTELSLARHGGRFRSIACDEELRSTCLAVLARLDRPAGETD
ncbi:HEAT repeat domain-containing protein [Streptomyces liangshanensis]|uniref:HEAT repeat domain-containing protein n=1 Tax=Streptomyces liangshanensis TaxID=2717324 RepID=UPI0036DC9D7D